jgi:hydroxypyruvate isomerase
MDRRTLLKSGVAALAAGALTSSAAAGPVAAPGSRRRGEPFQLAYAPHFGMFEQHAGKDPVAQLEWAAAEGFRAWEDNGMAGRPIEEQERIARAMERLSIRMGVFVANFGTAFEDRTFTSGNPDALENFQADLKRAVEVAKRVRARWMTIVLGTDDPSLPAGFKHVNAVEMLKRGAAICEPHGLVMVMEPLNQRDHPGLYLRTSDLAWSLCKAVGSPSVKILFDIYHQAISEGNLIPNLRHCWDEIAYFQMGDNPGRKEPGTGEVNYRNVFREIHGRGFAGILGMEHGNSRPGKEGEQAVVSAYREADTF